MSEKQYEIIVKHLDDAVRFLQDGLQIERIAVSCANERCHKPIPLSSALDRDISSTDALISYYKKEKEFALFCYQDNCHYVSIFEIGGSSEALPPREETRYVWTPY